MQLGGLNLVDPASVYPYYQKRGLSLELLKQCNSQEFRFIDGYGTGCFLLTQNIATATASFTVGSRTVALSITDKISLEHPSHSGGLYAYQTAEPKFRLLDNIVERSYNITIDKSLSTSYVPTIVTLAPDYPAKTLEEVIDDFLPAGYTLNYYADELTSYDISIEGQPVLTALDYLCSCYGLVWTADATNVYIWSYADSSSEPSEATLTDPINDIRHSVLVDGVSNVNVAFPIFDYCRQEESEYHIESSTPGSQGETINVCDPFYPAVVDDSGTLRNGAVLTARANLITDNLLGVADTLIYAAKHFFEAAPLNIRPLCLSEVYGDFGAGPRSIYRAIKYPYIKIPQVKPKDRYADNWIGALSDGYYGRVASFIVTPVYGLDGRVPPGPQTVVNLYGWDYGEQDATVRVEWDCVNHRWIALQQEYDCPPEIPPEPPVTPAEPVEPYPAE